MLHDENQHYHDQDDGTDSFSAYSRMRSVTSAVVQLHATVENGVSDVDIVKMTPRMLCADIHACREDEYIGSI